MKTKFLLIITLLFIFPVIANAVETGTAYETNENTNTSNAENTNTSTNEVKTSQSTKKTNTTTTTTQTTDTTGYGISTTDDEYVKKSTVDTANVEISLLDENSGFLSGVSYYIEDEEGYAIYQVVSEDAAYEIEALKYGTYYIVERNVPAGYVMKTGKIKFVVDDSQDVFKVEVAHKVEDKKKEKTNVISALLISFAMLDLAIAIGMIVYVKKNKVTK